jgi:hypothetical protein
MKSRSLCLVLAVCVPAIVHSVRGELLTYHADVVITDLGPAAGSVDAADISVGDWFHFQFTLDSSVTDSNPSTTSGLFQGLFTDFKMGRSISNVGTWDPQGSGSWAVPTRGVATTVSVNAIFNGVGLPSATIINQFANPPSVESTAVGFNPQILVTPHDTGAGQTFEEMVGPLNPTGIIPAWSFQNIGPSGVYGGSLSGETVDFGAGPHPQLVPEPSTWALLSGGVALPFLRRGKRSSFFAGRRGVL